MTGKILEKEISNYLPRLSSRQKQTVLTMIKTFAEDTDEMWNDDFYIAEIDRRFAEMEDGKVKTYSLEKVEAEAKLSGKK